MRRGYKNTYEYIPFIENKTFADPPWFGDDAFHASHRSNLLRKNPEHYGKLGWTEPDNLPYIWPQSKVLP